MGLYKKHATSEYQWGIWKVTESLDQLFALLPDNGAAFLENLNTFKSESRKIEWLAVRVLLYTLLKRIEPIAYHASGKPFFASGNGHISISHTKGYVSVIVSETYEVGIDIEKISDRVQKVAHKFVRDDEQLPEDPAQHIQALLLIWSAKEVMFKCMNEEAVDFREHMRIDFKDIHSECFMGRETRTLRNRQYVIHYILDPDFVMTYTVDS